MDEGEVGHIYGAGYAPGPRISLGVRRLPGTSNGVRLGDEADSWVPLATKEWAVQSVTGW